MRSCIRTSRTRSTSRRWPIGSVARLGYSASAIKPTEPARTRGSTSGSVRAATRCSGHTEGPTSLTDPSGLGGGLSTLREEPGGMRRRRAEATTKVVLPPTPLKSPEPARLATDRASTLGGRYCHSRRDGRYNANRSIERGHGTPDHAVARSPPRCRCVCLYGLTQWMARVGHLDIGKADQAIGHEGARLARTGSRLEEAMYDTLR